MGTIKSSLDTYQIDTYNVNSWYSIYITRSIVRNWGFMRIRRIRIENFRSIKLLEFEPADICALVGSNNAGKTNILTALNFLLGETYPSRRGLLASDYYNQDTTKPIMIGVEFEPNDSNIQKVWCKLPWDDSAEVKATYFNNRTVYNLNNDTRAKCALVYLDANRDLEYHMGYSNWKLFGRIVNHLHDGFSRNASEEQLKHLENNYDEVLKLLKTEHFLTFENTFISCFDEQIKHTTHQIKLAFRTFDARNYYRSIHPILIENGVHKEPAEAGQGMRNLILLALFRTYAQVFKDNAIIAVEEPEIYLHPHTRRSLATLFKDLAAQGNQVFYSTHSADFVDIEHFEQICLVEKQPDRVDDLCTQVQSLTPEVLLDLRRTLFPDKQMDVIGMRERYRSNWSLEHNEAFFAKKIVLVEGVTEQSVLPLYAEKLGYSFDTYGISVVNANSKTSMDLYYHLYIAFGIPVYMVFDNDRGTRDTSSLQWNKVLLRIQGLPEEDMPGGRITNRYAVMEGNFEEQMRQAVGHEIYSQLESDARSNLGIPPGRNKELVARYMARHLISQDIVPDFISEIIDSLRLLKDAIPNLDDIPF